MGIFSRLRGSGGYISAKKTVAAAAAAELSVSDYVERLWGLEGQTDAIVDRIRAAGGGGAASTSGFIVQVSDGAGVVSGMMTISLLDSSANTWASMHAAKRAGQTNSVSGGGTKSLSAELTTVRIAADGANTFDSGSVNVSYSL